MKKFIISLITVLSIFSVEIFANHKLNHTTDVLPVYLERELMMSIVEDSYNFLGLKYKWGAVGPYRFDCSGFTQYLFKLHGVLLPRTSREQSQEGDAVNINDVQPGDLIFFSSRRSGQHQVGHVGIVVEVNDNWFTFIHTSVNQGIKIQRFPDNGYYSSKFICIKRVI